MAYKPDSMRAERIGALARHVISMQASGANTPRRSGSNGRSTTRRIDG